MNFKYILTIFLLGIVQFSFAQTQDIDKKIDQSIDQMVKQLENIDLNNLLNEQLFGEIEKMKLDEKQITEMQDILKNTLKSMQSIDLSVFDGVFKEMEKVIEEIEIPEIVVPTEKKENKTLGKRI